MNRLIQPWFEYCGVKSTDMGVQMISMPVRGLPVQRGTARSVAGRDGVLWTTDGAYEGVEVTLEFVAPDERSIPAVNAWLRGAGLLRFSDEPELAYEARVSGPCRRLSAAARLSAQRYSVAFDCQPFRRLWPEAEAIVVGESGTVVENPGSAPALPRIRIAGAGDFSLSIGMETVFFTDVDGGGIIVDSERMDAFTFDGTLLANDRMSGAPFTVQPGRNVVSWLAGDGGSVNSVEILPRWRYV